MKFLCSSSPFRTILPLLLVILLATAAGCGKKVPPAYLYADQTRGAAIAATAKSQLGKPYRYGGASPSHGFDCSGLVFWACAKHGISVPRESKAQAKVGLEVHPPHLRPGDIVIFKTSWTGYHSGIYLGQNRFVHSPRPRTTVRIESLNTEYWRKNFVSARRVTVIR